MPEVQIELIEAGRALPCDADLIVIPGTKNTIADLQFFRTQGWDIDLKAHVRRGVHVLGICGGYQMLGSRISDPEGIEGPPSEVEGLGLLDVSTIMTRKKTLSVTQAVFSKTGDAVQGFEIHVGVTKGPDADKAWLETDGQPISASDPSGRILGCYLHGLFASDEFRKSYLSSIGHDTRGFSHRGLIEETLDGLADHLEESLDLDALLSLAAEI